MKLLVSAVSAVLVAGCAGTATLVRDGKTYPAEISKPMRTMSATIDGEVYKGSLAINQSFGFGNTFSGGSIGTITTFGSANSGRATLLSPSKRVLRCDLNFVVLSAQGLCQDSDGNLYDVVPE